MKKYLKTTYVPWRMLASLFLVSSVIAIYYITRPGSHEQFRLVLNLLAILYPIALGLLCFKGSRELLGPHSANPALQTSRRFSPALLGLGLFFFAFAQIVWLVDTEILHHIPVFPAPQHLVTLGMYPFFICAVLFLPSQRLSLISRLRLLLDGLIIMAAGVTFCFYFVLSPIIMMGKGTLLEKSIASAFPGIELVLMFCLLLAALRFGETALRPVLIMLTGAVVGLFVLDVTHLYEVLHTGFDQFSLENILYLPSGILIVGAAQTVRRTLNQGETVAAISPEKIEHADLLYPTERGKTLLPSALVLIFGLLVVGTWLKGGRQSFPGQITIIYIGGFIVLLLMVLRQFLAVYEVNTLQGQVRRKNQSLSSLNEQLEQLATSDPLTGLPNHRALVERLDEELALAQKQQATCSIIFIDIDYFKSINDEYGHLAGDAVLCQFGELVQSTLRATDHVGRWGGEELVAVLPGVNTTEALAVAERLRSRVEQQIFAYDGTGLHLTCSLGIASYPDHATEYEALITLADAAMYTAKRLGRNQTRIAQEPDMQALGIAAETFRTPEEIEIQGVVEVMIALQEARNRHTVEHERRVSALSMKLALALGLAENEAYIVSLGGLLHDLGKVSLPDEIVHKRGSLTPDEFHTVCRHPVVSAEILNTVPALHRVADIVRSHHEWVNGSGYPDGLQGTTIPLGARIVSVADAYDVITHARPYRQADSSAEALGKLQKSAGSQFDPLVVDTLIRLLTTNQQQTVVGVA